MHVAATDVTAFRLRVVVAVDDAATFGADDHVVDDANDSHTYSCTHCCCYRYCCCYCYCNDANTYLQYLLRYHGVAEKSHSQCVAMVGVMCCKRPSCCTAVSRSCLVSSCAR